MNGNNEYNTLILSLIEKNKFAKFKDMFKKTDNFYSFNFIGGKEKAKHEKKNFENEDFYAKYEDLSNSSGPELFELEKELANYIKFWHSTGKECIVDSSQSTQDDFSNEQNAQSNLLEEQYIKKNYSIIPFQLLDFVIGELEKKVFDIELLQNKKDPKILLDAPLSDKGFIEFLLNNVEEKLHNMHQGEKVTTGYSYVIGKLVAFDLFLIYIILKNYPFYVLKRERLEILFKSLEKYKSFPYPIGSIGMDLFKLITNELNLPGVTIYQEVRKTFFLDLIDPITIDINPSDFIKVVSFETKIVNSKKKKKEDYKINLNDSGDNKSSTNFKLHELKELTFTFLIVFLAYILYSREDKKDSKKEEEYFENILALFEKRLKQKKDKFKYKDNNENKENDENISEKNILNNLSKIIDLGLDSNNSNFSKNVKIMNDKLISKSKESHETTTSKPRDNISLRRFLYHNIYSLKLPFEVKKKFKPIVKRDESKYYIIPKTRVREKGKQGMESDDENDESIEEEENEDKESLEKMENIRLINEYKDILNYEKEVENDSILEDYIDNFSKVKKIYFKHLQQIQVEKYNYEKENSDNKEVITKDKDIDYNKHSKIIEKQLAELYKQKYIVKENQLIGFLKNLEVWKCNIRPLYHMKLKEEYYDKKEEEIEKKDIDSLNNDNFNNINILEANLRHISGELRNSTLNEEKEKIAHIIKSDLPFNYELYLIPGEVKKDRGNEKKPDNPLTKFISKQDFIYKSIIGDFYLTFFNEERNVEDECSSFLDTPIQLYLKEAQHFFNLKVFQCKIKTITQTQNEIEDLNISGDYYYLYGSIHIETESSIALELDKETIVFTNDDSKKRTIYIDIINIYNENDGGEINDIEKYLFNPKNNCFQVFVSTEKNGKNSKIDCGEKYLKKLNVPITNFDGKSLKFEAKKIVVHHPLGNELNSFKLTPTFLNINPTDVTYFEINYEPDNNPNRDNLNRYEDSPDLGVFSFDIKIKTFIDLDKSDD